MKAPPCPVSTLAVLITRKTFLTEASGVSGPVKCGAYFAKAAPIAVVSRFSSSVAKVLLSEYFFGQNFAHVFFYFRPLTILVLARFNKSRGNAQKQDPFSFVPGIELCHGKIQGRFAD